MGILKKYIGKTKDNYINGQIYIIDKVEDYIYIAKNNNSEDFIDVTLDEERDFLIKFAQKIYDDTSKEIKELKDKISNLELKSLGYKVVLEYLKNDKN